MLRFLRIVHPQKTKLSLPRLKSLVKLLRDSFYALKQEAASGVYGSCERSTRRTWMRDWQTWTAEAIGESIEPSGMECLRNRPSGLPSALEIFLPRSGAAPSSGYP